MIPNIKCYIFNLKLSKPTLPKLAIASIAINDTVQVGKNFIEDVVLDGGFGGNIITRN